MDTLTSAIPALTMNDGYEIPQLGLGVFKIPQADTERVVSEAFEIGYRHIDTAAAYGNEAEVGAALARSGLKREEVFVTTKLSNQDHMAGRVQDAFNASMDRLGLDYLDLYLIHWPMPEHDKYPEIWGAFGALQESGRVRSIGVSNFLVPHLERLQQSWQVVPAVDQIECHPAKQQVSAQECAASHSILVEAWGPLGQGKYPLLEDPTVTEIAARHGRSAAQVVLRWHTQQGRIVIPKSSNRDRLLENASIFDFNLTAEELRVISGMDREG